MPSLSQLLTNHGTLLLVDTASTTTQVGVLRNGKSAIWHKSTDEAGTAIFASTEIVLREAQATLECIQAFVYCEGPGSMLGVRTAAMTLRTWLVLQARPAYSFQSLALAGIFAWSQSAAREFAVVADARRSTWHVQTVQGNGGLPPLRRLLATEMASGEYLMPENFRSWAPPPHPVARCSYDLAVILPAIAGHELFQAASSPDAFQHAAPEYKKWEARIHQADPARI